MIFKVNFTPKLLCVFVAVLAVGFFGGGFVRGAANMSDGRPTDADKMGVAQWLLKFANDDAIVIISKSFCPFCIEAKDLFKNGYTDNKDEKNPVHLPLKVIEVNLPNDEVDTSILEKEIKEITKHRTFPQIFYRGKFQGGLDKVKQPLKDKALPVPGEDITTLVQRAYPSVNVTDMMATHYKVKSNL